ncbi:hypothetical protein EMCG_02735 [[Emmonsia] crescens]|uniref:Uncharacterized protein n=1 Tax=[Emmonsia] crescens TaxID=73230 RepID=A0A0G2HYL5_9EURO|nr:hypothetical protein EMCG_02735 [Emmonsia crescens UAMH 3008]
MEFELHCQYHLDNSETVLIQYSSLQLCGMPTSPEYSSRLLGDDSLSAIDWMKPCLNPQSLFREMNRYYKTSLPGREHALSLKLKVTSQVHRLLGTTANNVEFRISTIESLKCGSANLDLQDTPEAPMKRTKRDTVDFDFTSPIERNTNEETTSENRVIIETKSDKSYVLPANDDSGYSSLNYAVDGFNGKGSITPEIVQYDYPSLEYRSSFA